MEIDITLNKLHYLGTITREGCNVQSRKSLPLKMQLFAFIGGSSDHLLFIYWFSLQFLVYMATILKLTLKQRINKF